MKTINNIFLSCLGIAQNLLSVIITSSSILLPSNAIEYLSPDSSFTINYPEDFKISEKILGFTVKTHDFEVFMKSVNTKGYNAGVTVHSIHSSYIFTRLIYIFLI